MEASLGGTDHWNINRRFAAVDAQIKRAKRNHGVVALLFGALETFNKGGRYELNLGRGHTIKIWARRHINDAHLDLRRRIRQRHVGAPFVFFRRITADDKRDSNHTITFMTLTLLRSQSLRGLRNFRICTAEALRKQRMSRRPAGRPYRGDSVMYPRFHFFGCGFAAQAYSI